MNQVQAVQKIGLPLELGILIERDYGDFADFILELNQFYGVSQRKWLDSKLLPGLSKELYQGVVFKSQGKIVGDCIWRESKDLNYDIELKHFRVVDNFSDRGLATFIMNQFQFAHADQRIILDTTKKNKRAVNFFKGYGFKPVGEIEGLYVSNQIELFMGMYSRYTQTDDGLILPVNFKTQMRRKFLEPSLKLIQ